ncbi:MAG: hypothetical protein WBH31_16995 [Promethearchaeia archaeon]
MIVVGFFLIYKSMQNKIYNLLIGGFGYTSLIIGITGNLIFDLGNLFQEIFVFTSFVLTVIFTNMTFYKSKKKNANYILIVVIILGIIQISYYIIKVPTAVLIYIWIALDIPYTLIVFNWLTWSSYSAYKAIKKHNIQPWIKVRYKMIAIFSFILSFHNIPEFFQPLDVGWGNPSNIASLGVFGATAILAAIFSIGFAFAWIMPKKVKNYYNRHYKSLADLEINEKDLLEQLREELSKKS